MHGKMPHTVSFIKSSQSEDVFRGMVGLTRLRANYSLCYGNFSTYFLICQGIAPILFKNYSAHHKSALAVTCAVREKYVAFTAGAGVANIDAFVFYARDG